MKNAAIEPAAVATTEIDHTSRKMSSTRPAGVTGLAICEETVVSCAETPEQRAAERVEVGAAGVALEQVHEHGADDVDRQGQQQPRSASRERRNLCVRD